MRKAKRTLVGILVMISLFATGFAPVAKAQEGVYDTYIDAMIGAAKQGDAKIYPSNACDTTYSFYVDDEIIKTTAELYDMKTITSKYKTVLAHKGAYNCYMDPVVGYTSDGTAEIIYNIYGYDTYGRGRNYEKNVDGCNEDGFSKNYYTPAELLTDGTNVFVSLDKYGKYKYSAKDISEFGNGTNGEGVRAVNAEGDLIIPSHYKVTIEATSSVQKGCGVYNAIVTFDDTYGNKVLTTPINVIADSCVGVSVDGDGYVRGSKNFTGKINCTVMVNYDNSALKLCDGIQYVVSKDKNFKDIYANNTIKLKKKSESEDCVDKKFKAKVDSTCYIKYRVYTVVNGKKIYSTWNTYRSII